MRGNGNGARGGVKSAHGALGKVVAPRRHECSSDEMSSTSSASDMEVGSSHMRSGTRGAPRRVTVLSRGRWWLRAGRREDRRLRVERAGGAEVALQPHERCEQRELRPGHGGGKLARAPKNNRGGGVLRTAMRRAVSAVRRRRPRAPATRWEGSLRPYGAPAARIEWAARALPLTSRREARTCAQRRAWHRHCVTVRTRRGGERSAGRREERPLSAK